MIPPDDIIRNRPDVQALKDLVLGLGHGGTKINVPSEWLDEPSSWKAVMGEVYTRGRSMDATRIERRTMEKNECHKNTMTLFLYGQVSSFATGFALHHDTVWYFHSSGIRSYWWGEVIVETHQDTFQHYFGADYSRESGEVKAHGLYSTVTSPRAPFSGEFFGRTWEP